jgi:hypothetical protein
MGFCGLFFAAEQGVVWMALNSFEFQISSNFHKYLVSLMPCKGIGGILNPGNSSAFLQKF